MKVFLIVLAVIIVIFAIILSLSAEFTIVYDNGWHTKIKVLFIEKDIQLSKLLSFLLFPEKAAADVNEEIKEEKKEKQEKKEKKQKKSQEASAPAETKTSTAFEQEENIQNADKQISEDIASEKAKKPASKPNFIKKLYDEQGIVGILLLLSNLLQTVNSAITTLFKGLHIYSLYVKMIIGGADAADIGSMYGTICSIYYPVKGIVLNGMKVDQYDDYIQPDFIAPRSEYEFQFIASINVGLLLKVVLKAGKVFLVNLIKNK